MTPGRRFEFIVITLPLSRFCYSTSALNGLVLGFCAFTQEEMGTALTILDRVLASMH